jgi:putative redox protein
MPSVQVASDHSRYGQVIEMRGFHLTADEPLAVGGNDAGPTPMELVLAGLGSCKAITLKMYAERKGWALDHVSVDVNLQHERDQSWIQAQLTLTGSLTEAQQHRLLEIANRCPVHRLLATGIDIQTRLNPSN